MPIVGYERETYAEKRLILNASAQCSYMRVSTPRGAPFPSFLNDDELRWSSFVDSRDCDLVHLFNNVNYGSTPFVCTFETLAPRYWRAASCHHGLAELAKDSCRRLIALSEFAREMQADMLERSSVANRNRLMDKTVVLHPPQALIPNEPARFSRLDELRCIFVGGDFFRKGGAVVLQALAALRRRFPVHFTLVGNIRPLAEDNVTRATSEDGREASAFIRANADWITWLPGLKNNHVLRLLPHHHLGLLPSFADTYGYAVLEMQAAGLPVITTNIRAFPEINSEQTGWLIDLPHRKGLNSGSSPDTVAECRALLLEGLNAALAEALEPGLLLKKSQAASARIQREHDPRHYGEQLVALYREGA